MTSQAQARRRVLHRLQRPGGPRLSIMRPKHSRKRQRAPQTSGSGTQCIGAEPLPAGTRPSREPARTHDAQCDKSHRACGRRPYERSQPSPEALRSHILFPMHPSPGRNRSRLGRVFQTQARCCPRAFHQCVTKRDMDPPATDPTRPR